MKSLWHLFVVGILLLAVAPARAGETELSDPKPSYDEPRKIAFSMNFKDHDRVNSMLYNVINVQKFYGQDLVELVVVGWGPGIRPLLKKDSTVRKRIESLTQYGITFIACKNTMDLSKEPVEGLIDGVEWVQAGLPELAERSLRGWAIIWP